MSEDTLRTAYRVAYHRIFELQCILCDFPSSIVQAEIDKLERIQNKAVDHLGYMPEA